ncbi:inositol polyphosphate 5-phosphatase [Acrasis kona]|uniref:Inositol polyphosphate 5-phosphatase n=1 Tax=Acrasis kona TaxID=1008807 RepID=A0AAW2ZR69_9EUKA
MWSSFMNLLEGNQPEERRDDSTTSSYAATQWFSSLLGKDDQPKESEESRAIQSKFKSRIDEYAEKKDVSVVVATWNVASAVPRSVKTISSWLNIEEKEADIYVVTLQEIDMTASSLWYEETERGSEWIGMLNSVFKSKSRKNQYICLRVHQLSGLFGAVFIKNKHKEHIANLKSHVQRVGFMGVVGNKGAIAFRFRLYFTWFCFVVAHMTAHVEQLSRRNQDYQDIMQGCRFQGAGPNTPLEHDVCIFGGDLNYRMVKSYEEICDAIDKHDLNYLYRNDQLQLEMKNMGAFWEFKEPAINFLPTYRFETGTEIYDQSEKKRIPSYTDRILYRCDDAVANVNCLEYKCGHTTFISDHKYVTALFEVSARVENREKARKVYDEVCCEYDSNKY